MSYLYLVRHTKSEWNEKGLWTGWSDPHLSKTGMEDALKAGEVLKDVKIDTAFVATLTRAKETLEQIKKGAGKDFPTIETPAINERNYGIYTGKNKWQVKEEVGEEEFQKIRRSWDYPIKEGESLKQVYERVVPYYEENILPKLIAGENVLISANGNSLRALIKYLEDIPDEKISELELGMGEIYRYEVDKNGKTSQRETLSKGAADRQKKITT